MDTNGTMQQWEAYLDGALAPAERAALESAAADDPAVGQRRAAAERARQLRQAALASYVPQAAQADDLREQFLARLHVPAGRIDGRWSRYGAIAAMLVLTAGGFWVGRQSALPEATSVAKNSPHPSALTNVTTATNYNVTITDQDGNVLTRDFDNINDARRYAAQWQQNVADADTPNFPGTGSL